MGEDDTFLPFDPDDATYWAASGIPGVSAQIERGFSVVERYDIVLIRYADGKSIEQLRPTPARALDALARVAQREVGHFGKHGEDALRGALAAVLDTILNRAAHRSFPDTIETIVDQPKPFSTIDALGTWTLLEPATPPGTPIIPPHALVRNGIESAFASQGQARGGASYPSHSAIGSDVDVANRALKTIGGNEGGPDRTTSIGLV